MLLGIVFEDGDGLGDVDRGCLHRVVELGADLEEGEEELVLVREQVVGLLASDEDDFDGEVGKLGPDGSPYQFPQGVVGVGHGKQEPLECVPESFLGNHFIRIQDDKTAHRA